CVLPLNSPDNWHLAETFSYAVAFGIHLTVHDRPRHSLSASRRIFYNRFCVTLEKGLAQATTHNDRALHSIVYFRVTIISQALNFAARWHGFVRALFAVRCVVQLVSMIVAVYANWRFAPIRGIPLGWVLPGSGASSRSSLSTASGSR
ncbi:uncharacterized protein B0H18DRAFT_1160176, partial [Fomitopsis serialis]|uniref:uncharacterized protein n=1 Tax=Fomitopsis serialis TaxID=139415 RepID=UPI002007B2A9